MAGREFKRVAVTMEKQLPYLFQLDQSRPLVAIIEDLCVNYKLSNPTDYALQFSGEKNFVTERNRIEIRDGTIMELTFSPARTAQVILDQLNKDHDVDKCTALKQLTELSIDNTFAKEFVSRSGLKLIIEMIQCGTYAGEIQAYLLKSFVELMDHGIESWDILEPKFIKIVANCVNATKSPDVITVQSALEILESVVLHSANKYNLVEQDVTPMNLIPHLQNSNAEVQKNSIALINALFQRASLEKRKKIAEDLQSKSIRNIILTAVIHKGIASIDMLHQLYVLQSLLFNLLSEKRNNSVDINDQAVLSDIHELRQIAFDTDSSDAALPAKRESLVKDFQKLGFKNYTNPVEDFTQTPPGILALSNMMYFAKNHSENYMKVVLENSCRGDNHDLPFAHASIELTNMMCDILKVGDPPAEEGQVYYPMFFTHDHSFEEFYCICIQLLNKTWKEMRATSADFSKVFAVVREQIVRALENQPNSFDQFRNKLSHLTYLDITQIWQNERRFKEELEAQAKPILELREQIKPEIMELIKKQRLNHLVEGTRFTLKVARRTDKIFYCRISPNHKVFHYGDCDENATPLVEQLPNKLPICNIKELLIGIHCPHIKEMKSKKPNTNLAFTLQPDDSENCDVLNFIAPNEDVFNIWTDGINAVLGKPMTSEMTKRDLETLLSMEIKLRLLDTEGISIPDQAPLIPKEPPNYEFVFKNI